MLKVAQEKEITVRAGSSKAQLKRPKKGMKWWKLPNRGVESLALHLNLESATQCVRY